jgi:uncharacterized protein
MTAEVASMPGDSSTLAPAMPDDFDWRVSFAEVKASGEFSSFPGVDRIITLVDGPEMTLHLASGVHLLNRFEPFAFDGGVPVRCEVAARTRDLNVMTRRGRATAEVRILRVAAADGSVTLAPADPLLVAALDGAVCVVGDGATAILHPGDVVDSDEPLRVDGDGHVAVVRISAHPQPSEPAATDDPAGFCECGASLDRSYGVFES